MSMRSPVRRTRRTHRNRNMMFDIHQNTNRRKSEVSSNTNLSLSEIDAQFLIADFQCMRDFITDNNAISNSRINILLTLLTLLGTGLAFLYQAKIDNQIFLFIALISTSALFAIGFFILQEIVDRDVFIVEYIRNLNQIRYCFVKNSPYIEPYLLMPIFGDHPKFEWQSVKRHIPLVINAILFGMIISFAVTAMLPIISSHLGSLLTLAISAVTVVASAAITYLILNRYCKRRVKHAEQRAQTILKDKEYHSFLENTNPSHE